MGTLRSRTRHEVRFLEGGCPELPPGDRLAKAHGWQLPHAPAGVFMFDLSRYFPPPCIACRKGRRVVVTRYSFFWQRSHECLVTWIAEHRWHKLGGTTSVLPIGTRRDARQVQQPIRATNAQIGWLHSCVGNCGANRCNLWSQFGDAHDG